MSFRPDVISGTATAEPQLSSDVTGIAERGRTDVLRRLAWWLATAVAVATPLFISLESLDAFYEPKELLLRGGGIFVLAILLMRILFAPRQFLKDLRAHRHAATLIAMVVAWTAVATALSTNTLLSSFTLLRVFLCAVIALAALIGMRSERFEVVYLLIAPGVVNAFLVIAQERMIWNPIFPLAERPIRTGLIGNPNVLGTYLLIPALAAVALIFAARKRRLLHIVIATCLMAGIVATQSVTAIGAFGVGVIAVAAVYSWRRAAIACLFTGILISAVVAFYAPAKNRATTFLDAVVARDYNQLSSARLTAYATALAMFRDHPLTGVGPGCFALHYFKYKIHVEAEHPALRNASERPFNFGEAHNDHLEIMAVTGAPGYALLAAILIFVGSRFRLVREQRYGSVRASFVYAFSFALAAGLGVAMLAQFPLERAASTVTLLFAAAICVGWSGDA